MDTRKTLPWLANTAGIQLDRAEQLWNMASESAQQITGESDSARYFSAAHDNLVSLVENEVLSTKPVEDTPWLMIQAHLGVLPLIVSNNVSLATLAARDALCRSTGTHAKA